MLDRVTETVSATAPSGISRGQSIETNGLVLEIDGKRLIDGIDLSLGSGGSRTIVMGDRKSVV